MIIIKSIEPIVYDQLYVNETLTYPCRMLNDVRCAGIEPGPLWLPSAGNVSDEATRWSLI